MQPARPAELPDDPVESGGASLRASDVVVALGRVPEELKRPSVRAVMQQTSQREADFEPVYRLVPRRIMAARSIFTDRSMTTR